MLLIPANARKHSALNPLISEEAGIAFPIAVRSVAIPSNSRAHLERDQYRRYFTLILSIGPALLHSTGRF